MADAKGDITKEYGFLVMQAKTKTGEGATAGNVMTFDATGWKDGAAGAGGPFGISQTTIAAEVGEQQDIRLMVKGIVRLQNSATGAYNEGNYVVADDDGEVKGWTAEDMRLVVGRSLENVGTDSPVQVLLGV